MAQIGRPTLRKRAASTVGIMMRPATMVSPVSVRRITSRPTRMKSTALSMPITAIGSVGEITAPNSRQ